MKNFREFKKAFAVHVMIFSLLQTSFVFAQDNQAAQMITQTAGVLLNAANQGLMMKQQVMTTALQQQMNANLIAKSGPGCVNATTGKPCFVVQGKFFPECPLPASISSMPMNVCSSPSPNPNDLSRMLSYERLSEDWIGYFNKMLNEASNEKAPAGLKCLQDKKKALDSQMIEMVNNLTRLQDQLNKDKETFKANNQKLLDELATTNDELMGSSGKNNLKAKTQDFSKFFSSSCQSVIGDDLRNSPSVGFTGIMQALSPKSKSANDYIQNRAVIENEVRADIQKMQNVIAQGGLEDFLQGRGVEGSKYGSVMGAINKQAADFKLAKARIDKELAQIGYSTPTMDNNFSVDFEEFIGKSEEFFKQQYISSCVNGSDKSGIAISPAQILGALEQKSTNSAGTTRDKYRAALKTILDGDEYIEAKMQKIKALESTYQDITITYQDAGARKITQTPYQLYMKTIEQCGKAYAASNQVSLKGSSGVSQQKKVERGKALLRELKNLHDTYASDLGSRVLDKVLSCNGESKKAGASCNAETLDHTKDAFCMQTAGICANEIQGCYAEANKHVEARKTKMENIAKIYNNNAQAYVNHANQLFTQQKNAVTDIIKIVQARFPGTNFAIPEGMFIAMPAMKKDAFGVDLANDGNISFMDELPKKISLLKKVFEDQQKKADNEIGDYISKQTAAMEREKDRWENLKNECKKNYDSSAQSIAKQNAAGQKAQMEQDQKVAQYCDKYWGIKSNPVAGCEEAKDLASEMQKINQRLTPDAKNIGSQFKLACNAYNNEKSEADIECDPKSGTDSEKRNCAAKLNAQTARLKANANSKDSKASTSLEIPLTAKSLCKNGDDVNSDNEFVKAVMAKMSKEDRDSIEQEDLVKALEKKGDLNRFIEKHELRSGRFLYNIKEMTGGIKGEGKMCDALLKVENYKSNNSEINKKKRDVTKAKDALAKFNALSDEEKKKPENANKKPELESAIKVAEANVEELEGTDDLKEQQDNLKLSLASLKIAGEPVVLSEKEAKIEELNRIGQQITESCDAQASNMNMQKNMFGTQMPMGGMMGIGRSQ